MALLTNGKPTEVPNSREEIFKHLESLITTSTLNQSYPLPGSGTAGYMLVGDTINLSDKFWLGNQPGGLKDKLKMTRGLLPLVLIIQEADDARN